MSNDHEQNMINNKKFSFLQKNDRRSSAPGRMAEDFIPLNDAFNSPNMSNITPKSGLSFFQKAKIASQNNANNSISTNVPLSAALSSKLGIVSLDEEDSIGKKRPLTLLELEQMNKKDKKNRRKTLDQNNLNTPHKNGNANNVNRSSSKSSSNVPLVGYEISTVGTESLSSLQTMFMKKK